MGTIVVTENATLDGVIEQIGDRFAPAAGDADDADIVATLREQMQRGANGAAAWAKHVRVLSEVLAGPDQRHDGHQGLNRVAKYVFSRTVEEPGWENTTVLSGDLADEVRALKARVNGKIGVTGSITLVHGLIAAGLVNE